PRYQARRAASICATRSPPTASASRTTLSPALVLRNGKAWMSFGTPGGEQQDQWQSIMLLRMLHHGMNIQEAIDAPSFHSEHWVSSFWPRGATPGQLVHERR
ncbi:MAG: gamma-glutamyltransferase, partial [Alphaproteobacteria bacterium]